MRDISPATIIRRTDSQVTTAMEGETILLQLESGNYFSLNEAGVTVWNALDAPRTLKELCDRVADEYEVDEERCKQDVLRLVLHLADEHMVELD